MVGVELSFDGWTRKYIGSRGVILRKNPDHIRLCITAIQLRRENEIEIRYEEQEIEIHNLRGSGRVIPLETKSTQRKRHGG